MSTDRRGPYFEIFINAVVDILREHAVHYEFNEELLIFLLEQSYSMRFGNFAYHKVRFDYPVAMRLNEMTDFVLDGSTCQGQEGAVSGGLCQAEPLFL